jgi:hypothetical protein
MMDRRDAVKSVAILMGGVLSASTIPLMLDGCNQAFQPGEGTSFTEAETEMISRMTDVIIPRTDTPGAVDAGVPAFVIRMMQECYTPKDQQQFHKGLADFDGQCHRDDGNHFLKLSRRKQEDAVGKLDHEVLGTDKRLPSGYRPFYHHLKALTLLGFFTSEPGATKTLHYQQIPGHYDGCVPYHKGDKAWAS